MTSSLHIQLLKRCKLSHFAIGNGAVRSLLQQYGFYTITFSKLPIWSGIQGYQVNIIPQCKLYYLLCSCNISHSSNTTIVHLTYSSLIFELVWLLLTTAWPPAPIYPLLATHQIISLGGDGLVCTSLGMNLCYLITCVPSWF